MCGIVGLVALASEANIYQMESMLNTLVHRGPDGSKHFETWSDHHHLMFGHTRLSILDLSTAADQPMIDPDTGCVLVFNGEIYNYRELRTELERSSQHSFSSTGDTEVLLRAYIHYGIHFVRYLRGMFAFALYDPREQKLFLMRDHFGIKPLYYILKGNRFAFSSEVRTLLTLDWVERRLNPLGIASLLAFGSIQNPYTLVNGIYSNSPAHYIEIDLSTPTLSIRPPTNYWVIPPVIRRNNDPQAVRDQVFETLADSVRVHQLSDVPIGAFLSGGLDSSAIVALMAETSSRVNTMTIFFEESEHDERAVAREIAERFGTQHMEISLNGSSFLKELPNWLDSYDQPSSDGANTWIISRACREAGITVALSGLGSDELFGGYSTFSRTLALSRLSAILNYFPQQIRYYIGNLFQQAPRASLAQQKLGAWLASDLSPLQTYLILRRFFLPQVSTSLLVEQFNSSIEQTTLGSVFFPSSELNTYRDVIASVSRFETQSYLTNTLLRDADQMGMAHSIEIRVPFVDVAVAELVHSFPGRVRMQGEGSKPLLRQAMGNRLDPRWLQRSKIGFTLPFDHWLRGPLFADVKHEIERLSFFPFQPGAVSRIWESFLAGNQGVNAGRILLLYVLARWLATNRMSA